LKHGDAPHACFYKGELSLCTSLEELFHSLSTVVIKFFRNGCEKTMARETYQQSSKKIKGESTLLVEKLVKKVFL